VINRPPKAVLYHLNAEHTLTDMQSKSLHYMLYRVLTIGKNDDYDLCLNKLEKHCKYVSNKHAIIFYDENTTQYELLNYSEHGTIVDNVYYGLDIQSQSECQFDGIKSMEKTVGCTVKCKCDSNGHYRNSLGCCWEGSALLTHGSHIKFGCLEFVFCLIDYDSDL
jgi:pSer/pThr/pTyr-binding forkhead associated (FHA) protein